MSGEDAQRTSAVALSPEAESTEPSLAASLLRALPLMVLLALGIVVFAYWQSEAFRTAITEVGAGFVTRGFWVAAGVGLLAQVIDGALGMAYGITSTTFLLSSGVPPAVATASVHIAEVVTTGFSGLSHWKLGNVNRALFKRLVIPGVIGAVTGAYIVTSMDGKLLRPWISGYLLLMGLYILFKAFRRITIKTEPPTYIAPLALTGGFVDAVGGGGWGPVVTTSLLGGGHDPRSTIGSVNAAEFFLAIASGVSFAVMGGFTTWTTIAGLIFGGLFAAPLAAVLARYAPTKVLLIIVGTLISALSVFTLYQAFTK